MHADGGNPSRIKSFPQRTILRPPLKSRRQSAAKHLELNRGQSMTGRIPMAIVFVIHALSGCAAMRHRYVGKVEDVNSCGFEFLGLTRVQRESMLVCISTELKHCFCPDFVVDLLARRHYQHDSLPLVRADLPDEFSYKVQCVRYRQFNNVRCVDVRGMRSMTCAERLAQVK